MTRPRPEQAIAARKATRDSNREKIAWAITQLRASGRPVSKSGVAALAGVCRGTVYAHPDLLDEIDNPQAKQNAAPAPATPKRGGQAEVRQAKETQALLTQVREQNKQLRQRLEVAERAAHQVMGTAGSLADPNELAQALADTARLAADLMNASDRLRELHHELDETREEAVAAKQLNIDYFQQLNQERAAHETTRKRQRRTTITPVRTVS